MTERRFSVPEGLEGERIDAGLARLLGLSRSKAVDLIGRGLVRLDGAACGKSDRMKAGDWLEVQIPDEPAPTKQAQPVPGLRVLYEDRDLIVVDKPIGVAAHASPGWEGPTVVGGLAAAGYQLSTLGAEERRGVVHRLDVGTSGVMVVARSENGYRDLKRQFRDRTVVKIYHALVQGHPDPSSGTIDAPIGRHPRHDYRFAVVAGGKPSVTHYDTVEAFRFASLLRVRLETGRTHQIRVHMSAIHHPCVGDLTYGADPELAARLGLTRQWLHAAELTLRQPSSGEELTFRSDYPDDLAEALRRLSD
ncbi:MAG: RluA family pseudouridine synthase [Candidatus Nanopelagicales bacterium]|nr:RluA family pseudouridine synthase [Candidatus Nanopelagicales bacterium]MDZ4248506.1 RluA family pseudouridine synthase [Candidatus Nanopelagicales bacterium]